MRIEDINIENVKSLTDSELRNLRERANQIYRVAQSWGESLRKGQVSVSCPIDRADLFLAHAIIKEEMRTRNIISAEGSLDRKLIKRRLRDIDVAELPGIIVKENVVVLSGDFVTNPKAAKSVMVRIDADQFGDDGVTFEVEKELASTILDQVGVPAVVRRDGEGLAAPVLPLYDLVLVPKPATMDLNDVGGLAKRLALRTPDDQGQGDPVAVSAPDPAEAILGGSDTPCLTYVSKPYPGEHAARMLDPKGFLEHKRTNNKFGSGIHAIWGIKGGKSKLQSIRFSASKFTAAQAKAWLKEHKYRPIRFEAATGKTKKVQEEEISFVCSAAERIVGGVVYGLGTPADADGQGEFVDDPDEIWRGLKSWMIEARGTLKFMHQGKPVETPIVECFFVEKDTTKSGEKLSKGDWYLSCYVPPELEELWQAIKDGTITGFSMAGEATAQTIEG